MTKDKTKQKPKKRKEKSLTEQPEQAVGHLLREPDRLCSLAEIVENPNGTLRGVI